MSILPLSENETENLPGVDHLLFDQSLTSRRAAFRFARGATDNGPLKRRATSSPQGHYSPVSTQAGMNILFSLPAQFAIRLDGSPIKVKSTIVLACFVCFTLEA